jgi:negative regulator of sigma E activity
MNKILISLTFVTVVGTLSGCATKQDLEALSVQQVKTNQELISIHETLTRNQAEALDNTKYCYAEGKPYSKGAKVNGRVCSRGMAIISNGKPGPLEWTDPEPFVN